MVSSAATTVDQYLASLSPERRAEISRVREVVRRNLPPGYEEGMLFGMIGWYIPLARYPDTYNGQPLCLAGLAAQKQHNALYLMTVYGDKNIEKTFRAGFKAAGKKLDMGKSCVRFQSAESLALDVIEETIGKVPVDVYIASYEKIRAGTKTGKAKTAKPVAKARAKAKPAPPKSKAKAKAKAKKR